MTDKATLLDTSYAEELPSIGVATLHEANHRRGLMTGLQIMCGGPFAGRAVTVTIPAGDNLGIHWLLQDLPTGSVLCIASRGKDVTDAWESSSVVPPWLSAPPRW